MARILFIQTQPVAFPGLYHICGTLKSAGHQYDVLATNRFNIIAKHINEFRPDVVGFPCLTGMHREILTITALIKKQFPRCKTILGGIHPTLFPEIINKPNVDFICRGEGEWPTKELLDAIDSDSVSFDIPNISWKKNNHIYHNEVRPLIDPLDSLPFPDYSIYKKIPPIASDTYPIVFIRRGCPFTCTYCNNSSRMELYKGKGRFVRSFSYERIFAEVDSVIFHYQKTRAVLLHTDDLGSDINWLSGLLIGYRSRFNVPYNCQIRPEFINEKLTKLLKETNCHMIAFGIESGSEKIRKKFLKRNYSNEQIINAANLLKKYGIKFRTYNMVGFPTETQEEMFSTLKLNIIIKTNFPWCSIYQPYPKTELAEFCISQGYLDKDFNYEDVPISYWSDSIIKNIDRNFVLNLLCFFQLFVLFPGLFTIFKFLLKMPHNKLFKVVFKVVYSYICIKSERRSISSYIKLAYANRKNYK